MFLKRKRRVTWKTQISNCAVWREENESDSSALFSFVKSLSFDLYKRFIFVLSPQVILLEDSIELIHSAYIYHLTVRQNRVSE